MDLNIYWGESHDNTYQTSKMPAPIDEVLRRAASHLDFYAAAYYTSCASAFRPGGHLSELEGKHDLILEGWKSAERLEREWADVEEATRTHNRTGEFVTFPGYEWQGDGSGGDHNIYARTEGILPVFRVNTLPDLYDRLRGLDVLAIPHHMGYRPGRRGKDWAVHDEALSPFAEIFSCHGCSETDEEWIGLRNNSHMGPGFAPGMWQTALNMGLHVGCVGSTDNWGEMPGHHGSGRMAVLAKELTRESLWRAFKARHVYGTTGDRIRIDFRIADAVMGDRIRLEGKRVIECAVVGSDAIDRIELLRNGRVIATECHQGTWDAPGAGRRSRFKMRIEVGWGPRPGELMLPDHKWQGDISVDGGRMLAFEPCWISPQKGRPTLRDNQARFEMVTPSRLSKEPIQNANVFEFEADASSLMRLRLNGLEESGTVAEFMDGSREMWFRQECVQTLREAAGIQPGSPERDDIYHHMAFKAKIHRPISEAGYTARLQFEDDEPFQGETHYRIRVEQRNGQRAWSSPIWVRRTR